MNSIDTVFDWLLAATLRASVLAVVILGIQWVLRHRLPAAWPSRWTQLGSTTGPWVM